MPAKWKGLHLIVVNGSYASNSELHPNDKRIDLDDWKHKFMLIFGDGCGFWNAAYSLIAIAGRCAAMHTNERRSAGCREAVGDHVGS